MTTLGGSIFAHNAIKYDYCLKESIISLVKLCDEVIALDADSTDGTLELLKAMEMEYGNLRIIRGKWEQHIEGNPPHDRLAILANQARMELVTDYHFMLQADEVIHEDSYPVIRNIIQDNVANSVMVLRLNLYGDHEHYVKTTSSRRPCGDYIDRLARQNIEVIGDAESLHSSEPHVIDKADDILIYHYGLVRDPYVMVDKVIDMQSWFFNNTVDWRYLKCKKNGDRFDPNNGSFAMKSELTLIPKSHPAIIQDWVNERKHFYKQRSKP